MTAVQNLTKNKMAKDYLRIMLGTTILAIALNLFFDKMHMVTGGVTGLAIIIKSFSLSTFGFEIPLSVTNLVINIPLFLLAVAVKGKAFGFKTLFSTMYLSFALWYTNFLPLLPPEIISNYLLGSIYGGILAGVGLGLVFMSFATTGGTDLAASIIQHYARHYTVAQLMFVLDSLIIVLGFFTFGIEKAMYAVLSVYITAKMVDSILEGIHFSKAAFIISDSYQQIADELLGQLDRGVTGLTGKGMFTNSEKQVLFCCVSQKQIVKLKQIVSSIDEKAFVIVADVREVLGEGFKEYNL